MVGPAVLEYGYNAAVWAAPYVKSAAIATYNAGKYAYTVSSNAARYYGSTAVLNGIKWYGKVRTRAEIGYGIINNSSRLSFYTGLIDGFIKSFDFPPDTPYVIDNPIFSFGSDAMNGFIDILKKLVK